MVYAALEATLRAYAEGRAFEEVPSLRMLSAPSSEVRRRAEVLAERVAAVAPWLGASVEYGRSVPGAGSAPGIDLPTALIAVEHPTLSAVEIEARLRAGDPPVIGRVEHDRVMLDLRTVSPGDEEVLLRALGAILPVN
jgi:L-seryl-tRNA(Ser) seleniumtransferase